jgi:hypothetical protein
MELSFRRFLEQGGGRIHNPFSQNTAGPHNDQATAKLLSTTWTGTEGLGDYPHKAPGVDLEIPGVTRRSRIRSVDNKRDPIQVRLMDGTTLYLSLDEFNRINSRTKLDVGREISVTFQRREDDGSPDPSKIVSVG